MSTPHYSVEWLNQNALRNYPLAVHVTGADTSGAFELPKSVLVGLYLVVDSDLPVDASKFYLRAVSVDSAGLHLAFAYDDARQLTVARVSISRALHTPNTTYNLSGRLAGRAVIGDLSSLNTTPYGHFLFDPAGGALDPDCVRPSPGGVTAVYVVNGTERLGPFRGPLVLEAGRNTRLSTTSTGEGDPLEPRSLTLRIDAAGNDDYAAPGVCDFDTPLGGPIRRINAVEPGPDGSLTITGGLCIGLDGSDPTSGLAGLQLSNPCAKPCCGDDELTSLAQQLNHVSEQILGLRSVLSRLEDAVGLDLTTRSYRL